MPIKIIILRALQYLVALGDRLILPRVEPPLRMIMIGGWIERKGDYRTKRTKLWASSWPNGAKCISDLGLTK